MREWIVRCQKFGLLLTVLYSSTVFAFTSDMLDNMITYEIRQKIFHDKFISVPKLKLSVRTNAQIVKLSGNVRAESEAFALINMARAIPHVKDVDASRLKIMGSRQPMKDWCITTKLRVRLFKLSLWKMDAETIDSIVFLTGFVKTVNQLNEAVKFANSMSGVKEVRYKVTILNPV